MTAGPAVQVALEACSRKPLQRGLLWPFDEMVLARIPPVRRDCSGSNRRPSVGSRVSAVGMEPTAAARDAIEERR